MNTEIKALSELITRKRKLENDLRESAFQLVEEFKKETGVSPSSINTTMIEVTEFGSFYKEYTVTNVEVRLDIS